MPKLKFQYFGHLMQRNNSLEKTLMLGKISCKYQSWIFIGRTDAEAEAPILWPPDVIELTHWKRPWCWERLKVGGEEDDRGWDGWMASLTPWTWVWVSSRHWWWTGKPSMLPSMGLQRARRDLATELNWGFLKQLLHDLPWPSQSPGACSNSCPLNQWCYPTIRSSVIFFSFYLQSFPVSGAFLMSQLFASDGQSTEASASASVLPMNIQGWFPFRLTGLISLQSKGLSGVFSNTTVQNHQVFGAQLSL